MRILHLVRGSGTGMTAGEVAEATGLHFNTVRAHLDKLAESGLVTRDRHSDGSPGRPAWRYRAQARPESEQTGDRPYRDLAAALIGHLARSEDDPHAAAARAGRDWGRALAAPFARLAPLDGLLRVLDRLGFTPRVTRREGPDSAEVQLTTCPFLDLAESSPDVVCGVHLGVIGGALGALGASTVETELEPFATPGACVVRVRASSAGREGGRGNQPPAA